MADTKLSALTELAAAPASDDEVYIRDVSEAAANESKRITMANLLSSLPATTLGGTVTINGQAFDAGAGNMQVNTTGSQVGLKIVATHDGVQGPQLHFHHESASPAANDVIGYFTCGGKDSEGNDTTYIGFEFRIADPTDTSEDGQVRIYARNAGSWNHCMVLYGTGVLDVDASSGLSAATVGEFDDFDDALILKQGISDKALEKLEEIGVMTRKDSGSGWFLNVQAMLYLLAGGIYQNRARIDDLNQKLKLLPRGG